MSKCSCSVGQVQRTAFHNVFPHLLVLFAPACYSDVPSLSLGGSDIDVMFRAELSTVMSLFINCPRLRAAVIHGYRHKHLKGSLDKTRMIGLFPPGPEISQQWALVQVYRLQGQSMIFLLWNGPQIQSESWICT